MVIVSHTTYKRAYRRKLAQKSIKSISMYSNQYKPSTNNLNLIVSIQKYQILRYEYYCRLPLHRMNILIVEYTSFVVKIYDIMLMPMVQVIKNSVRQRAKTKNSTLLRPIYYALTMYRYSMEIALYIIKVS